MTTTTRTATAIRLPEELKRRIQGAAFRQKTTATALITSVLEDAFPAATPFTGVGDRLVGTLGAYDPALSDRDKHRLLREITALAAEVSRIAEEEADVLAAEAQGGPSI